MDSRRGIYSYPALQGRLAENIFAKNGLVDFAGPVIHMAGLSPEDLFVLLQKLRHVYAYGDPSKYLLPDEALTSFMEHCNKRIGEAYFRTPRTTIMAFINLLAVLEQNPSASWRELLGQVQIQKDENAALDLQKESEESSSESNDKELTSFKL